MKEKRKKNYKNKQLEEITNLLVVSEGAEKLEMSFYTHK
ncbi:hypothetical protein Plano_1432 [Planococcus sp. PAMC 21323]|nr:hypothetical protein Plano_1432 [Planococcus sp. PAMC 21323]